MKSSNTIQVVTSKEVHKIPKQIPDLTFLFLPNQQIEA